jgi:glycosyltransferase involved in cell wall biosynthesis
MSRPRVSVVLPVHDGACHLEACLESLRRQSFADFEVVAINDGSLDGTGPLLDAWAGRDPRIRPVHLSRSGLVCALNIGFALCRSELIARMDADDLSHSRRLEEQVRILEEDPGIGVVSCLVKHFPESQVGEGLRLYERWLNSLVEHEAIARERFVESPVAHPSVMMRRRLVLEAGGYRDCGWPEDYDLWLRLLEGGVRFAKAPHCLLLWREHEGRLNRRHRRYQVSCFLACKAEHLVAGPLASGRTVIVWGAGKTGRRLSRELLARGVKLAGFVDIDPRKIGVRVRGRPVVAPDELLALRGTDTVVLAAVAARGARELIRERLSTMGMNEGHDYWCVA